MAEPKTPFELADRMRDHRAQHRAHDGFVRETFTQSRDDARQTTRAFLDRYPKAAYVSEVEHWRELRAGRVHHEAAADGGLTFLASRFALR